MLMFVPVFRLFPSRASRRTTITLNDPSQLSRQGGEDRLWTPGGTDRPALTTHLAHSKGSSLFGRTKQDQTPEAARAVDESHASSEEKKGRPTPKRKDAEAAARERARMGLDEKAARKVLRERRMNETRKMREALKGGDEKNLPARDQGQVKRFVRDYVDSRLCIAEFLLVALVVTMFLTYRKDTQALLRRAGIHVTPQLVAADSPAVHALVGESAPYQAPAAKAAPQPSHGRRLGAAGQRGRRRSSRPQRSTR